MVLQVEQKQDIINKFRTHEKDTGSVQVQIGILTERINQLTEHFKRHPKDNVTKRHFLRLIGKRKRLLEYLKREDPKEYTKIIKELGLRK